VTPRLTPPMDDVVGAGVTLVPVPPGQADPATCAGGRPRGRGWPHDDTAVALGFAQTGGLTYLIVDEAGEVVGECGTKGPVSPDGVVEIGYGLAAPSRSRGVGTRAVRVLLSQLEAEPGLRVVRAHVEPSNVASRRLLERVGFRLAASGHVEVVYERTSPPSTPLAGDLEPR
jgi:RimJ/RimL family protein N-acetyltransferase